MAVIDFITNAASWIDAHSTTILLTTLLTLVAGGWVHVLRGISFYIDKVLLKIIDVAFKYFQLIVAKDLFAPSLITEITKKVYFFIAVIVLFKLVIRFMQYIIQPELVSDNNVGGNAIIRRTVVGMCLLLFIPTIFGIIREFQSAIINDDVVNKILMDQTTELKYIEMRERASVGRIVGWSVMRGFLNYDQNKFLDSLVKKQWENANANYEAGNIVINAGGIGYIDNYYYDYIPIISTIALGYTAWLAIKFCFDLLIRFFKLTILQIISPMVIVDYIFDGGEGSFKQWTKTVLATFLLLFIRILSISLVILVCVHMNLSQQDCINSYVNTANSTAEQDKIACKNSLLYVDENGEVDNMLRAAVVIVLLAFVFDLPKLFSQIFGLDLEQESSITGMVKKVGGAAKMVGVAGLAIGGGMLGGALGSAKAGLRYRNEAKVLKKDVANYNANRKNMTREERRNALNELKARRETMKNNVRSEVGAASKAGLSSALVGAGVAGSFGNSFSRSFGAQEEQSKSNKQQSQELEEKEQTKQFYLHQKEQSEKQTVELQNQSANIGGKIQSDEVKAKIASAKDFSQSDTVIGNLGKISTNTELTAENVVHIKDDTKVIRDNSALSLGQQAIANQKLDNISTTSKITADHVVNIDEKMDTVIDTTDNINRNVKTAVTTTQTIAQNTDKIINHTENIRHKVNQIEDNTFYSGIDAIETLELRENNSSNINKDIKLDSSNQEIKKEQE